MKEIVCENNKGKKIKFTYELPFYLISCDGLHNINGHVSGSKNAFGIGETYTGTSVDRRDIIITGFFVDNFIARRNELYNLFPIGSEGTFYYYENDVTKKITYRVENLEILEKGFPKNFEISLACSNPYFTDIDRTVYQMATWTPKFKFPLKSPVGKGFKFGTKNKTQMCLIPNKSNLEFGITIVFKANDVVKNPFLVNVDTTEKIQINKTLNVGDKIIVTTYRDNKNILLIPSNNPQIQDINYLMDDDSVFLQVYVGDNTYRAGSETGEDNLETTVEPYTEYEGI